MQTIYLYKSITSKKWKSLLMKEGDLFGEQFTIAHIL